MEIQWKRKPQYVIQKLVLRFKRVYNHYVNWNDGKQEKYRNKFYKFDDLEETENEEIVNEAFNDEEENKEV